MSESVRAVERALGVLSWFTKQTPELTMNQIAEQVGIHKSTPHRLLASLEYKRFIQHYPNTGMYRLGIHLLQLSYLTLEHNDLRQLLPLIRRLNEQCAENIHLTVLDDLDLVFINIVEGTRRVKLAAAIGQRPPVFATAPGKAFMGFMPVAIV